MIARRHTLGLALAICLAAPAWAQDKGTKAEATAMLEAAMAHIKKVGHDKAFADFNTDKANWSKKDLYVVGFTMNGIAVVNGANPKMVGKDFSEMKTPSGLFTVVEMAKQAKASAAGGWVDYDWANPTTKKVEGKSTLVRKVPDFDGFIGVGIYR
ncbi:hypothetical protein DBR42_27615 [Pelomonas sp. HMWF004]|nr:hypothetical protein DBR42_27615 [Pelomonas sp. HMWF004]